jgi:Flp pilus assembly pilin Flp
LELGFAKQSLLGFCEEALMVGSAQHRIGLFRRQRSAVQLALAPVLTAFQVAQDVVEYGLIIGTIALVILLGTVAFGSQIRPWFELLAGRITTTGH